jgi:methylenetetrahydrofolate reductase (NADPH)
VRRVLQGLGWVRDEQSARPYEEGLGRGPVAKVKAIEGMKARAAAANGASTQPQPIDYRTATQGALQRATSKTSQALYSPAVPPDGDDTPHTIGNASHLTPDFVQNTATTSTSSTSWDEFPNGRYGDARSPAFGEIDGYGVSLKVPPQDALRLWGTPVEEDDISLIFSKYLLARIVCIPWCDAPIFDETLAIRNWLLALNLPKKTKSSSSRSSLSGRGWWTVGSQPAVDGVPSSDPTYGFGPRDGGGYVYQKAFVEIFVDEADKEWIRKKIEQEGEGRLSFFAGNRKVSEHEVGPSGGATHSCELDMS